jgi:small subunit ribosomal protein S9
MTTKTEKPKKETEKKDSLKKDERYFEGVGGRKRASARVRIVESKKKEKNDLPFIVNKRNLEDYFLTDETRIIAKEALLKVKSLQRFSVSAKIDGGGQHAQAEALRHGLARALVQFNEEWRNRLKKSGFLKRDPRKKERYKFGLKKARKAPQWSKRERATRRWKGVFLNAPIYKGMSIKYIDFF